MYGIEQMLLTLAQTLRRQGHTCIVGVFDNTDHHHVEIANQAMTLDLPVVLVPCAGRFDWRALRLLRRLLEAQHIDVLHAHGYKADVLGYVAARGTGSATVSTCHNWVEDGVALTVYSALDKWVLRHFDRTAVVSATLADTLRRCGVEKERLRVIQNGIDVDRFASVTRRLEPANTRPSRVSVGFVGRLSPEKAVGSLIRAAARVSSSHPDARYVLVGSGPERKELENLVGELGLEGKVEFWGELADMPAVYAALDILVLPSLTEGFPMTVLEGLAAKKPIVASAVGAIPDVIHDRESGLLVAPGDVDEIAAAIERLIADRSLRNRLGERGYAIVQQYYSSESMTHKYVALYEEAVAHTWRKPLAGLGRVGPQCS